MNLAVFVIASIVALVLFNVGRRLYRFYVFYRRCNKIPGPDYAIPLLGFVRELISIPQEDRLDWFHELINGYKDGCMRAWLGPVVTINICNPEHIETILRSNSEITKSAVYEYLVPWLGQSIFTSTAIQWFRKRKMVTPAFHFSILEDFSEVMIDKVAILNSYIEREIKIYGDEPFDIFELCLRCTLDILCETAMGTNIHAQEGVENEYIKAVDTITSGAINRYTKPWLMMDWIFYATAGGKSFKAAIDKAQDLCIRIIKRKQEERKSGVKLSNELGENGVTGKRNRRAFLDVLLEANEKEDDPLTNDEIRDETNTFMFGGHDTVGVLVTWTLFCLGNELDVQRKLHEELDDILGDSDDIETLKKIPHLKYLERVIKEVLRLYPSATRLGRCLTQDMKIGEYTVPAGACLMVQIYELHRNSTLWPDPLRFDPDRFLPENIKTRHTYAYLPFSAGLRNCVGQKYAMLEAKILVAQIMRKFSVKSVAKHSTIKKWSEFTLKPAHGVYVNMRKRSIGDRSL